MNIMNKTRVFISSGGFGDVYRPPIPCKDTKSHKFINQDYVGKLFESRGSGKEEFEIFTKFKTVDPHNLFTISPVFGCDIVLSSKDLEYLKKSVKAIDKDLMDNRKERRQYSYQIILPFGGNSFYNFITMMRKIDIMYLINPMLYLTYKIAQMNKNSWYHLDIKNENILFNKDKGLLYLIDFGWMSKNLNDLLPIFVERGSQKKSKSLDYVYTPEIILAGHWCNGNIFPEMSEYLVINSIIPEVGDSSPRKMINFFRKYTRKWYTDDKDIKNILVTPFYQDLKAKCDDFKKSKKYQPVHNVLQNKEVLNKQETWSYGFVLFCWLYIAYETVDDTYRPLLDSFLDIICNKMVQYDVTKRITLDQAFNELISALRKHQQVYADEFYEFMEQTEREKISPEKDKVIEALKQSRIAPETPFGTPGKQRLEQTEKEKVAAKKLLFESEGAGPSTARGIDLSLATAPPKKVAAKRDNDGSKSIGFPPISEIMGDDWILRKKQEQYTPLGEKSKVNRALAEKDRYLVVGPQPGPVSNATAMASRAAPGLVASETAKEKEKQKMLEKEGGVVFAKPAPKTKGALPNIGTLLGQPKKELPRTENVRKNAERTKSNIQEIRLARSNRDATATVTTAFGDRIDFGKSKDLPKKNTRVAMPVEVSDYIGNPKIGEKKIPIRDALRLANSERNSQKEAAKYKIDIFGKDEPKKQTMKEAQAAQKKREADAIRLQKEAEVRESPFVKAVRAQQAERNARAAKIYEPSQITKIAQAAQAARNAEAARDAQAATMKRRPQFKQPLLQEYESQSSNN